MNQGPRPTCVACTIAGAHESARSSVGFQPAIEPLWWQLHEWGLTSEFGTSFQAAATALPVTGQCEQNLWPYNDALGFGTESVPTLAGSPPWELATIQEVAIAHDGVEDALEDELAAGNVLGLIVDVTDEFYDAESDGFIPTPAISAASEGYHALLLVGAWTDPTHGRVFMLRNSWGDYWGSAGYGLIGVDFLISFGIQAVKVEV